MAANQITRQAKARSMIYGQASTRRAHSLLLIQFILGATCITLWLIFGEAEASRIYGVSLFIVFQFVWSLWSWKMVTGNFFDPYTIFLVAAYLFNGGKAILEVFHLNEGGIENFISNDGYVIFSFSTDTMERALLLVFIGLGSVHLGALLAASRGVRRLENPNLSDAKSAQASRWVGGFLIFISFVPMLITTVDKYRVVMQAGYFGLFQQQPEIGFGSINRVLASFMVPGLLFLLVGSKGKPHLLFFSMFMIFAYVLSQAFTGNRMWWVMPLIAYVWLWHRQIFPIPKMVLWLGSTVIGFLVFPSIMVVRNLPGEERLSLDTYIQGFLSLQNPILVILQEMGGTILTIAHTLELIPAVRDFDFGLGYMYSILTIFPNLFGGIHPTVARGLYSHWLTYVIAPSTFYAGGGYGYSFIAEAYANFGWIGAPIVLGLIGFLFAKLVVWGIRSQELARSAAIATFLAFFLIYVRGESALVVRSLIWYAFVPYFLVRLLSLRKLGIR